jgi:hypothetical protein
MSRNVRVYRLEIVYPEGSHEKGWRPALWSNPEYLKTLDRQTRRDLAKREFRWPRERMFLSSSGAYGRACLLMAYGAEAEVYGSLPVTWPNLDDWGDEGWEHGETAAHWGPAMEETAEQQRGELAEKIRSGALSAEDAWEILGELEYRELAQYEPVTGLDLLHEQGQLYGWVAEVSRRFAAGGER